MEQRGPVRLLDIYIDFVQQSAMQPRIAPLAEVSRSGTGDRDTKGEGGDCLEPWPTCATDFEGLNFSLLFVVANRTSFHKISGSASGCEAQTLLPPPGIAASQKR